MFLTGTDVIPHCVLHLPSRVAAAAWVADLLRPLSVAVPQYIITAELLPVRDALTLLKAATKGSKQERRALHAEAVQAATPYSVERRDQVARADRAVRDVAGFQPPPAQAFFDVVVGRYSLLAEMGVFGRLDANDADNSDDGDDGNDAAGLAGDAA